MAAHSLARLANENRPGQVNGLDRAAWRGSAADAHDSSWRRWLPNDHLLVLDEYMALQANQAELLADWERLADVLLQHRRSWMTRELKSKLAASAVADPDIALGRLSLGASERQTQISAIARATRSYAGVCNLATQFLVRIEGDATLDLEPIWDRLQALSADIDKARDICARIGYNMNAIRMARDANVYRIAELQDRYNPTPILRTAEQPEAAPVLEMSGALLAKISERISRIREEEAALNLDVETARTLGISWRRIAQAAGISSGSAYHRWDEAGRLNNRDYQRQRRMANELAASAPDDQPKSTGA